MKGPISLLLASALLGSGCTNPGPSEPSPSTTEGEGVTVEALKKCEFKFPDGSPVPCRNSIPVVDASLKTPPTGWLCLDHGGDHQTGFAVYRSPQGNELGFQYYATSGTPVGGVARVKAGSSSLWGWVGGGEAGFIKLAGAARAGNLQATVYRVTFESDHPTLMNASIAIDWNSYEGEPWGIYNITKDGSYYVSAMGAGPFGFGLEAVDTELEGHRFRVGLPFHNVVATDYDIQGVPMSGC